MDCRNIRTLAAGRPAPQAQALIQDHLSRCPACQDELGQLPPLLSAPTLAIPPPSFAQRVLERLPAVPPAEAARLERRRRQRRRVLLGIGLVFTLLVLQLGLLGIFVDSSLPASLVGGIESAPGRALLALTVAVKPIVSLLSLIALPVLAGVLVGLALVAWAWLRLLRPPALLLVEVAR